MVQRWHKACSDAVLFIFVLTSACVVADAATVIVVEDGKARSSIVAPQESEMLQRAAEDLQHYFRAISGARVPIGSEPVEGKTPILLYPTGGTPDMDVHSEYGDAYVIEIKRDEIVLDGETSRAAYYAATHLLHRIGVRWYAPGELGEVIPKKRTIALQPGRTIEAPDFQTRDIWKSRQWALRNRLAGPRLPQGHAFRGYMRDVDIEQRPDFYPIVDGAPKQHQANISNPEVVDHFVKQISGRFEKGANPRLYAPHLSGERINQRFLDKGRFAASLCPDDGMLLDERPATRVMSPRRADPLLGVPSVTDGLVKFCNRVAQGLHARYPDQRLTLGFYVYSNYSLPPKTVKPDPALVPIIAPIAYNRFLAAGNPHEGTAMLLEQRIKQWGAVSERMGAYLYNYNLADTAMPFTRRLAWTKSLPRLYKWGVRYCNIESLANWHQMVPGNYVTAQLLWDVNADVNGMLNEFYPLYYGPAGPAMRHYNQILEEAYSNTGAYAGSLWSIHLILTPEVMQQLHDALRDAESKAEGHPRVRQRVEIARYSLNYADHWLAARRALNAFKLAEAARHAEAFKANYEESHAEYPNYFCRQNWSYFKVFHYRSLQDAGRVARQGPIIYRFPDEWTAFLDGSQIGKEKGLYQPAAKPTTWTRLKTYSSSLAANGHPHFRGLIWYRHTFQLPDNVANTDTLKLWFGGLDSRTEIWLNGKNLGTHDVKNFGPLDVDVTDAIKRQEENQLTVAVDNTAVTELGTGGIVRPVVIYAQQ